MTLTALACAGLVAPNWWPYALLTGLIYTALDLIRARFLRTKNPSWELTWYLLDQLAHLATIFLMVTWSDAPWQMELSSVARVLADP